METPAGAKTPVHILIVDDEPALLKMMSAYLKRCGYAVTTCDHTEQAAALVPDRIQDFSIAVLDATMEGIPMEKLARDMLRAHAGLRLLAASGYPVDMRALEAAARERVAFLHKPFTPEMLASAVRRMLGPEKEKGV
ncbi:MAG TPA: response regulator [Bryobacteraceae bacterium]|nr:response regulator [Bryobacteraceae bacterium]